MSTRKIKRVRMRRTRKALAALTVSTAALSASAVAMPEPASAATTQVTISGVVICNGSDWGVQGVWVNNENGSDGFASWWSFPGKPNAAKYSITVTASRPDPAIRLDVGCGGSTASWRKTLLTPTFRTRNGYTENRRCDTSAANRSVSCKPAPHGPEASGSMGDAGYCTDGAYRQWKSFTGYWPRIGGNAARMDNNASAAGFQVSSVPHAKSIVIFNSAAGGVGHAGWVTRVYRDGSTVRFDYIDMNGGSGGSASNDWRTSLFGQWATKTGKTWNPSDQAFIVAPT